MHLYKYFDIEGDCSRYFYRLFNKFGDTYYCRLFWKNLRVYCVKVNHHVEDILSGNVERVEFGVKFDRVNIHQNDVVNIVKMIMVMPRKIKCVHRSFSNFDNFITYYNEGGYTTDEDKREEEKKDDENGLQELGR